MNQQRSRRFRAAKDADKAKQLEDELREELILQGTSADKLPPHKVHWDSNVITPGTPFMDKIAKGIRYFVYKKINEDKAWTGIKVIISDASVPGEGEHKIVEYIRAQRLQAGYNANTKHVIHGLVCCFFINMLFCCCFLLLTLFICLLFYLFYLGCRFNHVGIGNS